jgi:hypothetical protein
LRLYAILSFPFLHFAFLSFFFLPLRQSDFYLSTFTPV